MPPILTWPVRAAAALLVVLALVAGVRCASAQIEITREGYWLCVHADGTSTRHVAEPEAFQSCVNEALRVGESHITPAGYRITATVAPEPTPTTGSATLAWTPPTKNTDGSPLTNLAGYKVYWGTSQGSYSNSTTLNNPSLTSYVVNGLTSGPWFFVVTAFNTASTESVPSNVASKTVSF